MDRLIIDNGDLQLEVIARQRSEVDPDRTHEVDLPNKAQSELRKMLLKLIDKLSDEDED